MYSTCIFCHGDLGKNEAIDHFPVGRRLAFDSARGRLWAVCRSCERWNLTPLEERWEAIEECERLFRDTKLRVSTDNIGLTRVKDGTTLVRVGEPQRPEMAAWRYGDQFGRRRRKHYMLMAGGVAVVGGALIGGVMAGGVAGVTVQVINNARTLAMSRTIARLRVGSQTLRLSRKMVNGVALLSDERGGFALRVRHKPLTSAGWFRNPKPTVVLGGDEALRAARQLLPRINHAGGSKSDVADAVAVLGRSTGREELFGRYAKVTGADTREPSRLSSLAVPARLALEMVLHEEDERRALEGELAELEDRWREAEEVAAISDDMFLPTGVSAMLGRLKGERG